MKWRARQGEANVYLAQQGVQLNDSQLGWLASNP
jgi:hypothetical protein